MYLQQSLKSRLVLLLLVFLFSFSISIIETYIRTNKKDSQLIGQLLPEEHEIIQDPPPIIKKSITLRRDGDNAEIVSLPSQPPRMVRMLFSIIASNMNYTQQVNTGVIRCLSDKTGISTSQIGAYTLQRFTPTHVQIEYYALVSEMESLTFPAIVDPYIRDNELMVCAQNLDIGLTSSSKIHKGRTVIAPQSGEIVSSLGPTPGWAIGAALGAVALLALAVLLLVLLKGEEIYKEEDYEDLADLEGEEEDEAESDEDFAFLEDRDEAELRTIAGQREERVVSVL